MGREKNITGKAGEAEALAFLKRKGYRILATNFRTPFGELDAVAKRRDSIIFVEVKTRITSSLGPPYLSVTRAKAHHLVKNALYYLKRYGLVETGWRIDVVSVKMDYDHKVEHIELIENAITTNGYDYKGVSI